MTFRVPLAALVLIVAVWLAPANPVPLSSDERQRLERGEVVVLTLLPPGGPDDADQGGTAMTVIQASPEAVWRVLVDYPSHRGLYPRVVGAEVLESHPARALVRYTIGVGPFFFGFHVHNYADPARRRLEWQLDHARSNGLFQENRGYWQIAPWRDGVLLTYAMAARTTLPAFLTRGAERDGLVQAIKAVRERAEQNPA